MEKTEIFLLDVANSFFSVSQVINPRIKQFPEKNCFTCSSHISIDFGRGLKKWINQNTCTNDIKKTKKRLNCPINLKYVNDLPQNFWLYEPRRFLKVCEDIDLKIKFG